MRAWPVPVALTLLLTSAWIGRAPAPPFGFSAGTATAQLAAENRFTRLPSAERLRATHRFITSQPHLAGSPRDRELAEYVRERFAASGLTDVTITTHQVLLPWPVDTTVEMVKPRAWRAPAYEPAIAADPDTAVSPQNAAPAYHAFSASGEVTAAVVYAGGGSPSDYDRLRKLGVDVRGRIVLVRYSMPYSYRGFKALTAQQRGAAGILMYSDPADDGSDNGKVYPDGPWGPPSRIQRGGIAYDFLVPGDPLTPGWASTIDARRIDRRDAVSLPAIVSAPVSESDARVLLAAIGGPEAPRDWRGGLPLTYRLGGGPLVVRMRVQSDDRIRPVWTVTGMLKGDGAPDDVVVVGNHRDAWVYGGVDPSSGTAALLELAQSLGTLAREGWRPRRSILFASWDAEEFSLTSSTEWGEQHAAMLKAGAVAYLNVDSGVSGPQFTASAVPALNRLLTEVAGAVKDPALRIPLPAAARDRTSAGTALPGASGHEVVGNRLGGGSDYTVFLNFLGVPVADFSFRGPYGVYHSTFDTHGWVERFGDPGFRYHRALTQFWGLTAMRLAGADVVPLDYTPYAARLDEFTRELQAAWTSVPAARPDDLLDVRRAAAELGDAARSFEQRRTDALASGDAAVLRELNRRLLSAERGFTDEGGLEGRPWYKHLVYAPAFSYDPEVLPGVAEGIRSQDRTAVLREAARLARAIRRVSGALAR